MPGNPFDNNASLLTDAEERQLKSTSRAKSMSNLSSSAPSTTTTPTKLENKLSTMKKRIRKGPFKKAQGPDDISISDSLCSGVLRDAAKWNMGGSIGSSIGTSIGSTFGSRRSSLGVSNRSKQPISGGVADFDSNLSNWKMNDIPVIEASASAEGGEIPEFDSELSADWKKKDTNESIADVSMNSLHSADVPSSPCSESKEMISAEDVVDDVVRREQRKERVKEKLDKYKRDQKKLKKSCFALEKQLAETTQKLLEVDSNAAFKIDTLESELRETRQGIEGIAKSTTKEVTDQSECIKTLGKKLIRQAHVIKRQKEAVEQYKVQLEGLNEEMAMQDERDCEREAELHELQEELESVRDYRKTMLQDNVEEMTKLSCEAETDAKKIMELEFHLQQKNATLDRVAKDVSEKVQKISELEDELDKKNIEMNVLKEELQESENSVKMMQVELENASAEIEEAKCKYESGIDITSASITSSQAITDRRESLASQASNNNNNNNNRRASSASTSRWFSGRNLGVTDDGDESPETFEAKLLAKEDTIQTLDADLKEKEEECNNLRSEMVKMSSTYKQDSYLKRKEIAKLKQQNAEYALKLRALEKAFKCVNATEGMSMVGSGSRNKDFHGHTIHGSGNKGGGTMGTSLHGNSSHGGSKRSSSTHSVDILSSKDEKAAAVKRRLGGWAPYEFPSSDSVRRDSAVVVQANFFDDGDADMAVSDQGSDLGMKGQDPEES